MKKIIYTFLPLIMVAAVALILSFFSFYWINYLLIASVILGLAPLVHEIFSSLKAKRIDLGFPVLVTIIILIVLEEFRLAVIFVLLILLGQAFREYILWRVEESVKSISRSLPDTAFVKKDREIVEVKISEIERGDTVIIKAGSRAPVDGVLLTEEASFDESVISGESKPVTKREGDKLIAGAINLSDYVEMRAIDTSENSTIAQVHKLVEEAQSRSAPLSRFTNRYAEITTAVALVLVILVFLSWRNILQALALWIALVPIIFAIIVPVATTIGISLLAKRGILVKNAEALENLTKVDTIVFDKTGTLTKGSPEISEVVTFSSFDRKELIRLVASVEEYSEHHLAQPILKKAKEENLELLPVRDVHVLKGKGIAAYSDKNKISIGSQEFMRESGVVIPDDVLRDAQSSEEAGESAIFVASDKNLVGIIFVADKLREGAKSVLKQLEKMGFKLIILTGDNKIVANKIAKELDITEVHSELLPEDKIGFVRRFKSSDEKVVMVGDGINDAPALAEANVGIAMGLKGVDVTLESAQVVLINDDLTTLPEIVNSSKKIFKIIKDDLFIASTIHFLVAALVIFNIIGVLGSTLFHQASSALVLSNTMRLFSKGKSADLVHIGQHVD